FHMLASDGIKLLDQHLLGHVALVLRGGVEMTGAGSGFQLDLFADAFSHDELLEYGCSGLRRARRGRAGRPGRHRCRPCRWYAAPWWTRAGGSSGFRFRPRSGAIAGWEESD